MNETNYPEIIYDLNLRNVWLARRISLIISNEQYIALLKGYQVQWDMRYGLIYNQEDEYFYSYRSEYVVGKYRLKKQRNNDYMFTEMYENPFKVDYMVIFECVVEACRQNNVDIDKGKVQEMVYETRRLNAITERTMTPDLGPQSVSDSPFTAKARKLQSLWRVENDLEIGVGPNINSKNKSTSESSYYGNMIKDGESNGRNFYFPETFAYAIWRVEKKLKDETINEYRLFNNLLSSMPMAFNLFHPLMMLKDQQPVILDKMIQNAFPYLPIYKVKEIGLEFIPTPINYYTNDKSAMDAFIIFLDKDGGEYIIAIETKYTDILGMNKANDDTKKIMFAIESGLFSEEGINQIRKNCTQIYRNFLLTEKFRVVKGMKNSYSVIIAPKDHPSTKKEISSIKQYLKNENKLIDYKLEDFVKALKIYCPSNYSNWLNWFYDRYLNFKKTLSNKLCK